MVLNIIAILLILCGVLSVLLFIHKKKQYNIKEFTNHVTNKVGGAVEQLSIREDLHTSQFIVQGPFGRFKFNISDLSNPALWPGKKS